MPTRINAYAQNATLRCGNERPHRPVCGMELGTLVPRHYVGSGTYEEIRLKPGWKQRDDGTWVLTERARTPPRGGFPQGKDHRNVYRRGVLPFLGAPQDMVGPAYPLLTAENLPAYIQCPRCTGINKVSSELLD
jgi:hypothetical protein